MCSTEKNLESRVKIFVEELCHSSNDWECINCDFKSQYDYNVLSQKSGVVKYRLCRAVNNLEAVILSSNGEERNIEVIFSDEKNTVYEVPHLDQFQDQLLKLEENIKDNITDKFNQKFTHISLT